jgi:hypothetical protein
MPTVSLLGSVTPASMLSAAGVMVGNTWDSLWMFVTFSAGLILAFLLIRFVLSLFSYTNQTNEVSDWGGIGNIWGAAAHGDPEAREFVSEHPDRF